MPISTMAALMLVIAFASGLTGGVSESFRTGRFFPFAFIVLSALLRIARLDIAPEFSVNLGALFYASVTAYLAFSRSKKRFLRSIPRAALFSVPVFLAGRLLRGDAAVLLSALVASLALPAAGDIPSALAAAALTPLFAALLELLRGLFTAGYGVFELTSFALDVQLMSAVVIVFLVELARFNRRSAAAAL